MKKTTILLLLLSTLSSCSLFKNTKSDITSFDKDYLTRKYVGKTGWAKQNLGGIPKYGKFIIKAIDFGKRTVIHITSKSSETFFVVYNNKYLYQNKPKNKIVSYKLRSIEDAILVKISLQPPSQKTNANQKKQTSKKNQRTISLNYLTGFWKPPKNKTKVDYLCFIKNMILSIKIRKDGWPEIKPFINFSIKYFKNITFLINLKETSSQLALKPINNNSIFVYPEYSFSRPSQNESKKIKFVRMLGHSFSLDSKAIRILREKIIGNWVNSKINTVRTMYNKDGTFLSFWKSKNKSKTTRGIYFVLSINDSFYCLFIYENRTSLHKIIKSDNKQLKMSIKFSDQNKVVTYSLNKTTKDQP